MKRSAIIFILLFFIVKGSNSQRIEPIENEFTLNWSSKIGNVTYRTNIISASNYLLIGSNGNNYRDYSIDKDNGLKVIDSKNGKVERVILGESYGDVDVNGVKVYDNKIYFGNDNDEFVCVDILGQIKWRLPLSGDVEHEPFLIQNNGMDMMVFAAETGELRAVNPENGNTIWEHLHPDFKGWRQGDNRIVFKIKTHFRSGGVFFSKPAVADLNSDGVIDLVYSCNYDEIRAINGANGRLLWSISRNDKDKWSMASSYHHTPILAGKGNRIQLLVPKQKYNNGDWVNKFSIYDRKGKFIRDYHYKSSVGNRGLNSLNISSDKVVIPFKNALAVFNVNNKKIDFVNGLNLKYTYTDWQNKQQVGDRFSYDPLLGNQLIKYNNEECIVLLYQSDYSIEKRNAVVCIIGLKSRKVHGRFHLPSGSEFAPHISDVNKDGKLDLLVGCNDGKLYCYNMGISTRNMLTKEKTYSISQTKNSIESTENVPTKNINELSADLDEEVHEVAADEIVEAKVKKESENNSAIGDSSKEEQVLSAANLYLISYASFALMIFVGASIYLFRNKDEDSLIDMT